MDLATRQFENN